ncbi:MAG: PAS domain S-box protein [Bdellovibrionota bacterium]
MFEPAIIIHSLTILILVGVAVVNIRMIRKNRERKTWIGIAAAIQLVLFRQVFTSFDQGTLGLESASLRLVDAILFFSFALLVLFIISALIKHFELRAYAERSLNDQLEHSESRFQSVVDSISDAIVVSNEEGVIIYCNSGGLKLFGYTKDEVLNKPLSILIPERYRSAHAHGLKRFRDTGETRVLGTTVELSGLTKSGEEFDLELTLSQWDSDSGKFFAGIMRDITLRKRLEMEREQFFQVSLDMIMIADTDGYFKRVNPVVTEILGYTPEEFISNHALYYIHPDDVEPTIQALKDQQAGNTIQSFENRYRCKDGHYKWLSWKSVPIGHVTYGVARDITALKEETSAIRQETQKALILAEQRLGAILRHAPIVVFTLDDEGIITFSEGKALESLKKEKNESVGQSMFELYSAFPWVLEAARRALEGEVVKAEGNFGQLTFQLYIGPAKGGGVIGLGVDTTEHTQAELKRAEFEIREKSAIEASQMKSEFLANMSHEIRTPINGIVGMTTLLLETPLSPLQKDYAESVQTSSDALLTIINDILDFSKVEAGQLDLEVVDFSMTQMIHELSRTFAPLASRKQVRFLVDNTLDEHDMYRGDPGRIRQILLNLISNALKFTAKGDVRFRIAHEGQSIRFEVKDSGIGISGESLSKLFKAFSQADASTTRRFGGTGLGLSISKKLVELMKGEIFATSSLGEGSTFWFNIPIERAHKRQDVDAQPTLEVKPVALGARILVAEDNIINQKVALTILKNKGYRATAVANGLEVLTALRSFEFDLILMDCQMPEMDGYEATRSIREDASLNCQNIPIVAMTASAIKGDKEKCLAAGMNDYLSKPINQKELVATLNKWLLPANLEEKAG